MTSPPSLSRLVAFSVVGGLALAGCDRGWLMTWLTNHGVGEDRPSPTQAGSLPLHEVDCPAGLARCVEGSVEIAEAFRHPDPCQGGSERCTCPWQVVGRCPGACVSDGLSLPLPAPAAVKRLCAPGPTDRPVASPPPLGSPPPARCGEEPYRCDGASVVACPSARIVATCVAGCAENGGTLDDPEVDDAAAVFLLCAR